MAKSEKINKLKTTTIKKYKSLTLPKRFLVLYTLFFLVISFFVFFEFIINKKTLIWSHDGYTQHLKSAVYISKWIRGFVYNLVKNHTIAPDTFSFGLGYGGDVITTLNFYGFGDIIYLPTLYMNEHVAVHYHNFIIYLRYYLAGISFFLLFNYFNKEKGYRIYQPLCGALLYSFCGYTLAAGLRHPQFIMPMVMFPIVILGLEKLLREKKPNTLILSIYISSMANFILFFMMAVLLVVYFIWRELETIGIRKWKDILRDMLKTAVFSLLGLCLAGGIIVPVIVMLVNDTRTSNGLDNYLFYSVRFIRNFFAGFISMDKSENWTFMGFGTIGILSVLYLIANYKNNKKIFRAFIIITVLLFLPLFGFIIYGTSYAGNRWVWVYSLFVSYITSIYIPKLFTLTKKEYIKLIYAALAFLVLCLILDYSLSIESSFHMIILFVAITIIGLYVFDSSKKLKKMIPYFATGVTIISVLGNAYFYTSYKWVNIASDAVDFEAFSDEGAFWNTDADLLNSLYSANSFYRYSGNNVETNGGLLPGVSSTGYFWSTSNKYINEYRKVLGVGDGHNRVFYYFGLDDRPYLMSLASVYIYEQKRIIDPYGFETFSESYNPSEYVLLRNKFALPLGYGYTKVMSRDTANTLVPADLERAMFEAAVVEDNSTEEIQGITNNAVANYNWETVKKVPYEITTSSEDIVTKENEIYVTNGKTELTLDIPSSEESEDSSSGDIHLDYLVIKGINFKCYSKYKLYKGSDAKYDPNSLYGKDEWNELTTKNKRNLIKDNIYYIEPDNVTLRFAFHYSDDSITFRNLELHSKNSPWGTSNKDFIINAGPSEEGKTLTSVDIIFPNIGKYSYDYIKIMEQPLNRFPEKYNELNKYTLTNVDLHKNKMSQSTHKITADYETDTNTFLCLSIPYSEGWSIYVDGDKKELIRTNIAYMGTYVPAGKHNITLKYETPGLKIGLIIAAIGLILFLLIQLQLRISSTD